MRSLARHLTPSMAVALLALGVAGGGVGYAAATIGSAEIADNSIKSADVKNGTLQEKDLSPKARKGLAGADGADAFSAVITERRDNNVAGVNGGITVFSDQLSPGSYTYQAKTVLTGIPVGNAASCVIKAAGQELDRTNTFEAPGFAQMTNMTAFTITATATATYFCEIEGANGNAANSSLVITKVNTVARTDDVA